jgi:hypothetical protein
MEAEESSKLNYTEKINFSLENFKQPVTHTNQVINGGMIN